MYIYIYIYNIYNIHRARNFIERMQHQKVITKMFFKTWFFIFIPRYMYKLTYLYKWNEYINTCTNTRTYICILPYMW